MKEFYSLQEFATILKIEDKLNEATDSTGAGLHEVHLTDLATARKIANDLALKYQSRTIDDLLPKFDQNYQFVKTKIQIGIYKRKDMPVVGTSDVKKLQHMLRDDHLHLSDMFGSNEHGKGDDRLRVHVTSEVCGKLKPLQKQVYYEKGIVYIAKNGVEGETKGLEKVRLCISKDNYIIDGHHRWLTACLIDPKMPVHVFRIGLNGKELLDLMNAYTDHVGNERNV